MAKAKIFWSNNQQIKNFATSWYENILYIV